MSSKKTSRKKLSASARSQQKIKRQQSEKFWQSREEQETELQALEAIFFDAYERLDGDDTFDYPICFQVPLYLSTQIYMHLFFVLWDLDRLSFCLFGSS